MAEVFGKSNIIFGMGYVGYNKNITTLKNRDFDATMSGALYITTRCSSLLNLYDEDSEIVCYNNIRECVEKIQYYLDNETEKKK